MVRPGFGHVGNLQVAEVLVESCRNLPEPVWNLPLPRRAEPVHRARGSPPHVKLRKTEVGADQSRCSDVMVAHMRVWQHFSIDHPVYGRYSTAVHIS